MWTNPGQDVFGGQRTVGRRYPISPTTCVWESNPGHRSWQQALLPAGLSILEKKPHLVNSEGVRAPEPADLWLQVVLCVCEPSLLRCTTFTLPPPLPPSLPSGLEPRALSSKAKILPLLYTLTQWFASSANESSLQAVVETREEGAETK